MRVLVDPLDAIQWTHRLTCTRCNSSLEADARDLCHEPGAFSVECPVCGGQNGVDVAAIPEGIRLHVAARAEMARRPARMGGA